MRSRTGGRVVRLLTSLFVLAAVLVAVDAAGRPPTSAAATGPTQDVRAFGGAPNLGGAPEGAHPVVGMAADPGGTGYWVAASDGGVFAHEASFHGSAGAIGLSRPAVGITATPSGDGYWLVANDGGVFAYGDAGFHGSTGAMELNEGIVGMATTPTGGGYWLVASDGGIFAFGDAGFHGSTGGMGLNQPISAMAATPTGGGYWLVAEDGGIFAFGDARFHGSAADLGLRKPVVAMAATPSGGGYWLVSADGGVFTFGDAPFHGVAAPPSGRAVAGFAARPGGGYWTVDTLAGVAAPPLPPGSGHGRRIVYSNSRQRVWLVEGGEVVVHSHLVSGKRGVPRSGTYRVFSKSRYTRSGNGAVAMEYMVRFARGTDLAIGFHSIPYYPNGRTVQSEQELGQYRSAGCVRQRKSDAIRLWDFAPVGTTVVVTP